MKDTSETRVEEIRKLSVIPELIAHHLDRRPDLPAVTEFNHKTRQWVTLSFRELYEDACDWARAFAAFGLKRGDRAAMLLPNGISAVCFDQGALMAGLAPVPLHAIDTAANCAFILKDSGAKILVTVNRARWNAIRDAGEDLSDIEAVVFIDDETNRSATTPKELCLEDWLKRGEEISALPAGPEPEDLAALVYTSGTTGKPKGVMLTHKNIMSDISALLYNIAPEPKDKWLSFLPLSHTFERTTSYYIGLGMGNHVTFSRGINKLLEDLKLVRPTLMMSVPRVFEKVASKINERLKTKSFVSRMVFLSAVEAGFRKFQKENGTAAPFCLPQLFDRALNPVYEKLVRKTIRDSFGGRLRLAVSGGAALSPEVSKMLIGLGINIHQGYGMTETSPILSVNPIGANHPDTVGPLLPGVEAKIGERDELLVRGPQVMKGYWGRPSDTAKTIDADGWLATGDQADILEGRYLRIKGRIKEIIVTSTGEKVAPADIEQAIQNDPLFEQVMIYGENRPFICALIVANKDLFESLAREHSVSGTYEELLKDRTLNREVLKRIKALCKEFPQYGLPRAAALLENPWTIEGGTLTPTLKLKRHVIVERNKDTLENLYQNFGI